MVCIAEITEISHLFLNGKTMWEIFLLFVACLKYLNFIRHSLNWQTLCERNKKIWISAYIFLELFKLGFKFWYHEMTEFPNEIIDSGPQLLHLLQ